MATQGMELRRSLSDPAKPLCSAVAPEEQVSLTVRTLDKTEHQISVAHDIPVPQLKSKVATITSIDADSQVVFLPVSIFRVRVCFCRGSLAAYRGLMCRSVHRSD